MARRLTSSDWDAVLGSSSLRRISDSKPYMMKPHLVYIFKKTKNKKKREGAKRAVDGEQHQRRVKEEERVRGSQSGK